MSKKSAWLRTDHQLEDYSRICGSFRLVLTRMGGSNWWVVSCNGVGTQFEEPTAAYAQVKASAWLQTELQDAIDAITGT